MYIVAIHILTPFLYPIFLDRLNFLVIRRYSLFSAFQFYFSDAESMLVTRPMKKKQTYLCMYLFETLMEQEPGLLEIARELTLGQLISVRDCFKWIPNFRMCSALCVWYCPVSVCSVEVSINQWHHEGSQRACLSGSIEGPRWDLVCLRDKSVGFFFLSLNGQIYVCRQRFEGMRFANNNPWQRGVSHLPRKGRGEKHIAESCCIIFN